MDREQLRAFHPDMDDTQLDNLVKFADVFEPVAEAAFGEAVGKILTDLADRLTALADDDPTGLYRPGLTKAVEVVRLLHAAALPPQPTTEETG